MTCGVSLKRQFVHLADACRSAALTCDNWRVKRAASAAQQQQQLKETVETDGRSPASRATHLTTNVTFPPDNDYAAAWASFVVVVAVVVSSFSRQTQRLIVDCCRCNHITDRLVSTLV